MTDGLTEGTSSRDHSTSLNPIDDLLRGRYGDGRRRFVEHQRIRETYLAIDVRMPDGSRRGFLYRDLDGQPTLDAGLSELRLPFLGDVTLVLHGHRLKSVYRAVLHQSLDRVEIDPAGRFLSEKGDGPVVTSVEMIEPKV